jgi:uncharacterized protein
VLRLCGRQRELDGPLAPHRGYLAVVGIWPGSPWPGAPGGMLPWPPGGFLRAGFMEVARQRGRRQRRRRRLAQVAHARSPARCQVSMMNSAWRWSACWPASWGPSQQVPSAVRKPCPSGRPSPPEAGLTPCVEVDETRLAAICDRYGIAELKVFGSRARGTERSDSDIDVLYSLRPGRHRGWEIEQLADEPTDLFGHKVRLVSLRALHPLLQQSVLAGARPVYAA